MKTKPHKSGEKVRVSRQYAEIGPRDGRTEKEIAGVKGQTFQPAPKSGTTFKLVDWTKH